MNIAKIGIAQNFRQYAVRNSTLQIQKNQVSFGDGDFTEDFFGDIPEDKAYMVGPLRKENNSLQNELKEKNQEIKELKSQTVAPNASYGLICGMLGSATTLLAGMLILLGVQKSEENQGQIEISKQEVIAAFDNVDKADGEQDGKVSVGKLAQKLKKMLKEEQ